MEESQIPFLGDISSGILEETKRLAEYFLQFLWKYISSNYGIIGPHYSAAATMDAAFTEACLQDAIMLSSTMDSRYKLLYVMVQAVICP